MFEDFGNAFAEHQNKPKDVLISGEERTTMTVSPESKKHTLRIENCESAEISVMTKCKHIVLTNCKDVTVNFVGVITSCDAYKCEDVVLKSLYCKSFQIEQVNGCVIDVGDAAPGAVFIFTNTGNINLAGGGKELSIEKTDKPIITVSHTEDGFQKIDRMPFD